MIGSSTTDSRIKNLLDQAEIKYEVDSDGDFKVLFGVGDGRSQVAFINSNTERLMDMEIREIWSVAHKSDGPLPQALANDLLERNKRVKLGSWGVTKMRDGAHLTIYTIHMAAETDVSTLVAALKVVLEQADGLEQELTGDRDAF